MPCSVESCEAFRTEGPDAPEATEFEARARSGRRWRINNTFTNLSSCWLIFQVDSLVKSHVEAGLFEITIIYKLHQITNSDDMVGRQTL